MFGRQRSGWGGPTQAAGAGPPRPREPAHPGRASRPTPAWPAGPPRPAPARPGCLPWPAPHSPGAPLTCARQIRVDASYDFHAVWRAGRSRGGIGEIAKKKRGSPKISPNGGRSTNWPTTSVVHPCGDGRPHLLTHAQTSTAARPECPDPTSEFAASPRQQRRRPRPRLQANGSSATRQKILVTSPHLKGGSDWHGHGADAP